MPKITYYLLRYLSIHCRLHYWSLLPITNYHSFGTFEPINRIYYYNDKTQRIRF